MTFGTNSDKPVKRLSVTRLVLLTMPWVGIGGFNAIRAGVTTPVLELYGLSGSLASLVWISGPLTGFITDPIGAMSDKCTSKYGRRRPFIVAGLVTISISTAALSFTYTMGQFKTLMYPISFIVQGAAITLIQTPLRALISDLAPSSQQEVVQLLAVVLNGIGSSLGVGIMKFLWTGTDPSELPQLMGTVLLAGVCVTSVTCFLVKDEKIQTLYCNQPNGENTKGSQIIQILVDFFKSITIMDRPMKLVCAIHFFTRVAMYGWNTSASTWFARNVFSGCTPTDPLCTDAGEVQFQQGTSLYSLCGMFTSALATSVALAIAIYMQTHTQCKPRVPYATGLLVGSTAMILAKFGPALPEFAFGIGLSMGITEAVAGAFPFAIIGRIHAQQVQSDVGRDFGILNIFICFAHLLITFIISGLRAVLQNDGLPWVLFIAGVALALAAGLVTFLKDNKKTTTVSL